MRQIIYILLILFLFFQHVGANEIAHDSYYVVGCRILTEKGDLIRSYPGGMCGFFDDGSRVATGENSLSFYDAKNRLIWKKNIHAHHSMRLSLDQKRILVLSSEVQAHGDIKIRSDVLLIMSKGGEILHSFKMSSLRNRMDIINVFDWDKTALPDATHEISHVNSIYEIPKNLSKHPALKEGNFVVNDIWGFVMKSSILFFDANLTGVIYELPYRDIEAPAVHDVHVLENGKLLFFQNRNFENRESYSSVVEYDIDKKLRTVVFKDTPPSKFQMKSAGSVQKMPNGAYVFIDNTVTPTIREISSNGSELTPIVLKGEVSIENSKSSLQRLPLNSFLRNNSGS